MILRDFFLLLNLCKCSANFDEEFKNKMNENKETILNNKKIVFNKKSQWKRYFITLKMKVNGQEKKNQPELSKKDFSESYCCFDLEIWNDDEIEELKKLLKQFPEDTNHIFFMKYNFEDRDAIKYIKYLLSTLEEQTSKIRPYINNKDQKVKFYELDIFYNEIKDTNLTILYFYHSNGITEKIKMKIDNSDISKCLKELFFLKIKDTGLIKKFFFKSFLNYRLIFIDIVLFKEDIFLLDECKDYSKAPFLFQSKKSIKRAKLENDITLEEHENILKENSSIYCLLLIFRTLLGTEYFLNFLKQVFSDNTMERYHFFTAILRNLKIEPQDISRIHKDSATGTNPSTSDGNLTFEEEISRSIESLKVKDNIIGYKRLLIFFYQYLEKDLNLESFKAIIGFVKGDKLDELRTEVIEKVNRQLLLVYKSTFENIQPTIVLDFNDKRQDLLVEEVK